MWREFGSSRETVSKKVSRNIAKCTGNEFSGGVPKDRSGRKGKDRATHLWAKFCNLKTQGTRQKNPLEVSGF